MNLTPILAQVSSLLAGGWIILAGIAIAVAIIISIAIILSRYTKVGPNEVLIISGRDHRYADPDGTVRKRGFRIVKGGGTFVYPVVEKVDVLSLELMTIDVQTPEVYTSKGVPVKVDGVAQVKVKGDDVSIATAAEQFLGKSTDEIRNVATQTLEGHLRAILGTMTVEDIYQNRDAFAAKVQEVAAGDMANMGLAIVSFTIRDIRDNQGYLEALGKPRIAQVKKDAIIAQAEADMVRRQAQPEAVALAQARLNAAQANLALVQSQAKRYALSSPLDGIVLDRSVEPGETAQPAKALLTIANMQQLEMTLFVPIRNLKSIQIGQAVSIHVPSVPESSFAGKVTYVAQQGEFKPANIYNSQERSEMVFAIKVMVPNNGVLKAGLPADAAFQ